MPEELSAEMAALAAAPLTEEERATLIALLKSSRVAAHMKSQYGRLAVTQDTAAALARTYATLELKLSRQNWQRSADTLPAKSDAIGEDELVWTWTDPASPFAQGKEFNSTGWEEVLRYPEVYPFWTRIQPLPKP